MPAMPPPRIATVVPTPTLAGQSPGRGDCSDDGGGGETGGLPGAADDDPQPGNAVEIPSAVITRSIADAPTDLPIVARNSRRAIDVLAIRLPPDALTRRLLRNSPAGLFPVHRSGYRVLQES